MISNLYSAFWTSHDDFLGRMSVWVPFGVPVLVALSAFVPRLCMCSVSEEQYFESERNAMWEKGFKEMDRQVDIMGSLLSKPLSEFW